MFLYVVVISCIGTYIKKWPNCSYRCRLRYENRQGSQACVQSTGPRRGDVTQPDAPTDVPSGKTISTVLPKQTSRPPRCPGLFPASKQPHNFLSRRAASQQRRNCPLCPLESNTGGPRGEDTRRRNTVFTDRLSAAAPALKADSHGGCAGGLHLGKLCESTCLCRIVFCPWETQATATPWWVMRNRLHHCAVQYVPVGAESAASQTPFKFPVF